MPLPKVHVRGLGLACALGKSLPESAQALAEARVNPVALSLPGFDEPVQMPYYRIPDPAGLFDPSRFDRLLPMVAEEALRGAGIAGQALKRLPIFVGSSAFSVSKSEAYYARQLAEGGELWAPALPLVGFQHIADTLQKALGIQGETHAYNTACTAGANALLMAARMIATGRLEQALVVGLELANLTTLAGFSGLQLVAKELKPFDLNRAGIVLGEGIGAALLSREGDGRFMLAGGAANIDTYSVTTANPDGGSIAAVQNAALKSAGLMPQEILGIKAHGTASPMNDSGEAAGIRKSFLAPPRLCALKPFLGHTLGACGVNELALFGAALERGLFPATPNFETPDPSLGLSPEREAGPAPRGHYLLNFFGFGGHNTSLIVEGGPR